MKTALPRRVYVKAAHRSPIGKFGGNLSHLSAPQLAGITLGAFLERAQSPKDKIDLLYLGHARQAGAGPNPARQATIYSGLSEKVPAITVNQACASGITAVIEAAKTLCLGRAQNIIAGGVESMSNTPYLLMKARWGYRMGAEKIVDGMHQDGFFCPMSERLMGATVEDFIVPEFKISRAEQDQFALTSQQKAEEAWKSGEFLEEVLPMPNKPKGEAGLNHDEHRRADATIDQLQKLSPVFNPKNGTITAGNSSGITDGAAFLHLTTEAAHSDLAELLDWEITALDPKHMGLGPIQATKNLLERNALKVSDIDYFELNEAFAAQALACQRALAIPDDRLNVRGGAIALGHPIGCTGSRIICTLLHTLKSRGGKLGIATLCVSGGMGVAALFCAKEAKV